MTDEGKAAVSRRGLPFVERAEVLFRSGCNCSQAVFVAFADALGMDEETALRVSSGFGGGLARQREVCGAVAGATMVLGMRHGPDKAKVYAAVQAFCEKYRAACGSIICRELLEGTGATSGGAPDPRTPDYYRKRPCVELVKLAVRFLTEE